MATATGRRHVSLGFYFLLVKHIGIHKRDESRSNQWDKEEPQRDHSAKEGADERQHTRHHEQNRAKTMRFVPNLVTGECPGGADADEEVAFCFAKHISNEEEQNSQRGQHSFAHLEICVTQIPAQGQSINIDHERDDQRDEQVEHVAELSDICLERVNARNDKEENHHSKGDQRHQKHAPEFGHVSIDLVIRSPVGCHEVRQTVPEQKSRKGCSENHN